MACDLEAARITSLPADSFYISDFVSEDEEAWLLQKVASAPRPRWTKLSHRRLQTWPSPLTKSNTLLRSPLPTWLVSPVIEPRLRKLGIFNDAPHGAPNHVLVNEYHPGQGIMPHEDGAAYYPLVATVSLGAPIVLDVYTKTRRDERDDEKTSRDTDHTRKPQYRILQERRSLLITRADLYTDYLHGIAETTRDDDLSADTICNWDLLREKKLYHAGWYERETRTSLTYRDVLKVAKMGNSLKFLGGR
ncbi:uncharacterized protein N7443_002160 [Penicillium atrosanguineum]|uniref:uncharacterized protein n=1 Tax=Penicillium atrosanguineum TaxID=1132637 RepID=UPI0023A02C9F|nr:uncharacterized protein N7443_002160 [Penicillium atrosanguineum]KAJ5309699.1 hypothetical protein N7443_002160 [Penicillium atrosanguineum]